MAAATLTRTTSRAGWEEVGRALAVDDLKAEEEEVLGRTTPTDQDGDEDPPSPKPPFRRMPSRLVSKSQFKKGPNDEAKEEQPVPLEETGKAVVQLRISKDMIGRFVGKNGKNIKTHIIEKTKMQLSCPDTKGFHCTIVSQGDNVFARLQTPENSSEQLEQMKENVEKHQSVMIKNEKFSGQSKFVFKTGMEHFQIGKFIGAGGGNIKKIREKISEDEHLSNRKVFVQIKEDKPFRMERLTFDYIKLDDEPDEKVLITVTLYTNDRVKSFEFAQAVIKEAVENIHMRADTNSAGYELDDEEDPWALSGGGW